LQIFADSIKLLAKQRLEFTWRWCWPGMLSISRCIHCRLTTLRQPKPHTRFSAITCLARGVKLKYKYLCIRSVFKLTVMNVFYIYWMPTRLSATMLPWTLCLCVCVCVWVRVLLSVAVCVFVNAWHLCMYIEKFTQYLQRYAIYAILSIHLN